MTSVGQAIRRSRKQRGWSIERLAEEASAVEGAPEITPDEVGGLERSRQRVRLDDPEEPLPYVLKALGLGGAVVLQALGLAA